MLLGNYYQCICENGHYYTSEEYYIYSCSFCNAKNAWYNFVDEKNKRITLDELKQFLLIEEEKCSECHLCTSKPAVYKIPPKGFDRK